MTIPSELYFHSSLWGGDWIAEKSKCLKWAEGKPMQELVNRRIAIELNVKRRPRNESKYSTSISHTWARIFPINIFNDQEQQEKAFEYVLRHTNYTPRRVLGACDSIISEIRWDNDTETLEEMLNRVSQYEWSEVFRKGVHNYTARSTKDFYDLFNCIYVGLDTVLELFSSKPSVWHKPILIQYLEQSNVTLIRKDTGTIFAGVSIIKVLQKIGFLGLGRRTLNWVAPTGREDYELHFSYLDSHPYNGGWEIAVVSPEFHDPYDVRPIGKEPIVPHKIFKVSNRTIHAFMRYDPKNNSLLDKS